MAARYGEFVWVKASDLKTAKSVDSPYAGSFIVIDPDGDRVGVWSVLSGEEAFLTAMDEAHKKFASKEIVWSDGEPDPESDLAKGKLYLYAFVDDKEASTKTLKALEHPWIAKDHDRMVFIKSLDKDGALAKRYQVSSLPTLICVDPSLKPEKQILGRRAGEANVQQVRALQRKALETMKKAAETAK